MGLLNRAPLTPAQQAEKDRQKRIKEQLKADRRRAAAELAAQRAEQDRQRVAAFPYFEVRQTRAVTVKAGNMDDAIALATAAFKEGQDSDFTIKWHKPWGVEGDTIDEIRTINVKAQNVLGPEED